MTGSTDGVLHAGDYREITVTGLDKRRHYRVDVDPQGRRVELYEENGVARPIDAGVRHWVAEVARLDPPPAPPAPPPPPEPPKIADAPEIKSLLPLVAADPGVSARLGPPLAMASDAVDGRISIGGGLRRDNDGNADVRFDLRGPDGRATVHVRAQLDHGTWSMDAVNLEGPDS